VPESPLFCPNIDFQTIISDEHCSSSTYELLRDMRNLTDIFIADGAELVPLDGELSMNYDLKALDIRDRLASLPSAHMPGLPTTKDWVYETCRIAALIYTAAIFQGVPFSVAADSIYDSTFFESDSHASTTAEDYLFAPRLPEALYEALIRTDTTSIWNNMSGVLYWVCAVGAAAARTSATVNMSQKTGFRDEAYAVWVRRCLIMASTRTMIVSIFLNPTPLLIAQKRLLKVQELIGATRRRPFIS
jgi:hypothetical protein